MVRRATVVLGVIGLLWQTAACSSAGSANDPPAAQPSVASPAPSAPTGDVPGPLPWGARTLTGVVERSGDCTMLLVGRRRWALTGPAAEALSPGATVTVRGNLTTRPAACGDRDLAQTIAVTRVEK